MQDLLKVMSKDQCITANDLKNGCVAEDQILMLVPAVGTG